LGKRTLVLGLGNPILTDDGVGVRARRSRERSRGTGLGLTNTSTRLNHLYGENHEFQAGPRDEGGYAVRVTIPYKLARAPAPITSGKAGEFVGANEK